jgi:hypothetical protein
MIALSMEERQSLALSGTFEAVFTASTQERQADSILATSIWRAFSGLSHLQETRIVGKEVFTRASGKSVYKALGILFA